jgi:hypothetical protein
MDTGIILITNGYAKREGLANKRFRKNIVAEVFENEHFNVSL